MTTQSVAAVQGPPMAPIRPPRPVLFVASVFTAYPAALDEARAALESRLGPPALALGPFPFTETGYYAATMGDSLQRCLFAFDRLAAVDGLPALKHWTNELEARFAGRPEFPVARPMNVDPGYVTPGKLVLASTKDHAHRLYLGDGIFGEVTLWFRNGRWETWPWTYPDYASERFQAFFRDARALLVERHRGTPDVTDEAR